MRGIHRLPSYAHRPRARRHQNDARAWRIATLGALALLIVSAAGMGALWRVSAGDPVWWLTHSTPPTLRATAPDGPQRGRLTLSAVPVESRAALTAATVDGVPLPVPASPAPMEIDTASLPDGRHVLRLEATDRTLRRNVGALELVLLSDNTPPRLEIDAGGGTLRAGAAALVRWGAGESAEVTLSVDGQPAAGLPGPAGPVGAGAQPASTTHQRTLVVAPVETAAGQMTLAATARDRAGNAAEQVTSLPVEAVTLPRQALQVPPGLAGLATGPVAREESARIVALTAPVGPERRWSGTFRLPLQGTPQRTTGFGDRRDYADGHAVYHAGYDYAAPAGTPVLASAAGAVLFSGAFPQRGSTVILDHGWGITTVYGHLQAADLPVGQAVAAGDAVGRVGNTGLSTGPHLHWEVRLRGVPIDPGAWLTLSGELGA